MNNTLKNFLKINDLYLSAITISSLLFTHLWRRQAVAIVKNLGKYSASFTHWFNDTINLIFIILFLSSIFSILFLFFNWLISWITRYTYSIDSWILFCCRIHIYGLVWLHIFHHIEISPCDIPGYAKYCENSLNTPMIVSIIVTGINMIIYANYLKDIYFPLEKDQPM